MSGFTPGPWTVSKRNDSEAPYSVISGAELGRAYAIAMCPRYRGADWADDARLIAAAPTMHEYITKRADAGDSEAKQILESINAGR